MGGQRSDQPGRDDEPPISARRSPDRASGITVRPRSVDDPDHDGVAIAAVLEAVRAAGQPGLGTEKWLDLAAPHRRANVTLLAEREGHLLGLAQLSRNPASWGLELAIDPSVADDPGSTGREVASEVTGLLLRAALDALADRGGGRLNYWILGPDDRRDHEALELGFRLGRRLRQLRCPLPVPESRRSDAPALDVRPFRPGHDEEAWLTVNNRAFADHPEQGSWDRQTLETREAEDWFDPAGFLLHWEGERLIGSCWTKVHRATEPPMGEIYVISVDPDHHGGGTGRALVLAGLDWLHRQGLTTGMLYVDAANAAATRLYTSLGFTVHHTDRAYLLEVAAD